MKKGFLLALILIGILAVAVLYFRTDLFDPLKNRFSPDAAPLGQATSTPDGSKGDMPAVTVIAEGLEIPWDIAFLPEGGMLVSERPGRLQLIKDGVRTEIKIDGVKTSGEGGLLGIALHPDFENNRWLYIYYGAANGGETRNRIERYKFADGGLTDRAVIMDNIPGAIYHDGGRMEFGPDGMLYVTTGDATRENIAQDKNSLGGKILRLRDDGSIPEDNPFPGSAIWSYGHRNPQGLAWDGAGRLWETEHGRSGIKTGMDELNLIEKGANFGWPVIEGDARKTGMIAPILHSGPDATWAPASLVYRNGSLFFGGLRGAALYEAVLDGERVKELKEHFKGEFGRIRTVRLGPDGMLYLTTSNRDGRWEAKDGSDKIIRVDPGSLE